MDTHVTELVCYTGEGGAEGRWRNFCELDGNLHSPGGEACPPCMQKTYQLTTPQAPCTPNWMQKAPAARAPKLVGRIQSGMNAPVRRTKMLK